MSARVSITLGDLAATLGGTISGDPDLLLNGVTGLEDAHPASLIRVEDRRYLAAARESRAGAVLAPEGMEVPGKAMLHVPQVKLAFARAMALFHPEAPPRPGTHPDARLDPTAEVHPDATIGPFAVVGPGCRVAAGAVLHAHAVLIADVMVGEGAVIYPHVVLYPRTRLGRRVRVHAGVVLGADGFGYEWSGAGHFKIPQVGGVEVQDDVEIGANTTIDSGTTSPTVVGAGTKIDNQVQIGHNVRTGPHCLIVAQVGIAGSTRLGAGVVLGGQVAVRDHVTIGDGAQLAGTAGVWNNLEGGQQYSGSPARPHREELRYRAALLKVPELLRRLRAAEQRLAELERGDVPGGND